MKNTTDSSKSPLHQNHQAATCTSTHKARHALLHYGVKGTRQTTRKKAPRESLGEKPRPEAVAIGQMTYLEKYKGIEPLIIDMARAYAGETNDKLHLRGRDNEDLLQEFIVCGWTAWKEYRPGALSLKAYITTCLSRQQIDLIRKYTRDCRKAFLYETQEPEERDGECTPSLWDTCTEPSDIVGKVHVEDIISHFTPRQQGIALLLLDGKSLKDIAASTGLTVGLVRAEKRKIQQKVKNLYGGEHVFGECDEQID